MIESVSGSIAKPPNYSNYSNSNTLTFEDLVFLEPNKMENTYHVTYALWRSSIAGHRLNARSGHMTIHTNQNITELEEECQPKVRQFCKICIVSNRPDINHPNAIKTHQFLTQQQRQDIILKEHVTGLYHWQGKRYAI